MQPVTDFSYDLHDQSVTICISGGGERDRTDDLLRARQALSQLSYTPKSFLEHAWWA